MHSQQAAINNCHKRYAQLGHLSLFLLDGDCEDETGNDCGEREEMGIG